jgi:hypothetical protein
VKVVEFDTPTAYVTVTAALVVFIKLGVVVTDDPEPGVAFVTAPGTDCVGVDQL